MKRKTLITITAAAAVLTLAGCGSGGAPANLPDGYVDSLKNVNAAEKAMFKRANQYRVASGLVPFDWSDKLHIAGKAHSKYCDFNGHYDHDENPNGQYYFGTDPTQRQRNAGYQYPYGEDLDYNGWGADEAESGRFMIDDLMTAIYHRMPLLDQAITEIGTGVNDEYGQTGAVEFGVAPKNKMSNLPYVLYPAPGAMNVVGGFSGESPDPLKDTGATYSGNPISVFFKTGCNVKMEKFTLRDINESSNPSILKIMTGKNDPNHYFSNCDFALYPSDEMRIGHYYEAKFKYNGGKEIKWQFRIYIAPPPDIPPGAELVITDNNQSFEIKNGITYYLNIHPGQELQEKCGTGWMGNGLDLDINHFGPGSNYYTLVSNSQIGATAEVTINCVDDGKDVDFNVTIVE